MKIQISKPTPIANAPDELCYAINKWTEHEAFMSNDPDSYADLIHFNNAYFPTDLPSVIQYHSEPTWKGLTLDCPCRKLVIAQYHSTLPEYSDCDIVRNVINFDKPEYAYRRVNGVKVAYSPSSKVKVGQWHDKGFEETTAILEQSGVEYDVITDVSLSECLERKNACSVVIDECVTGSYHRSALEGLAMGKPTICYLSKEVLSVFMNASGNNGCPFFNVHIDDLEAGLGRLIDNMAKRPHLGMYGKLWMIKYWHPKDIAEEFIKIYKEVIDAK